MTQAKHKDKIQEIMGLVDAYANACEHEISATYHGAVSYGDSGIARKTIESKLRELVREPLSDEEVDALWVFCGNLTVPQKVQRRMIARTVEAAHNITNTSN